ncbi:DUF6685 family protein [Pantoea ananatis]|uniref:DUF6685 family protein n=1 Tax=Pantoea ananas TaxID=553 RepID=UPI0023B16AC1|nr:DUF6685 family protein [Pantoea ananatis]
MYWHEWMYCDLAYHARKYHLDYRTPGAEKRRLEMKSIYMPDVEHMIQEELIPVHELDITEIGGISASKSQQHDIVDIDEFPLFRCKDYLEPITAAHLKENMDHGEIRLDDMHFKDFTWTQRRIYWINAGGSHHLASARHQAIRLNIPVTLQGKMTRLRVDSECIRRLRSRWDMYLVPKDEVFGAFFKAMNAFMCPFGHSELPRHFHNPSDPNDGLRVIWLLKESPKASAVARVLKDNGFPDFGTELELLSRYDPL